MVQCAGGAHGDNVRLLELPQPLRRRRSYHADDHLPAGEGHTPAAPDGDNVVVYVAVVGSSAGVAVAVEA